MQDSDSPLRAQGVEKPPSAAPSPAAQPRPGLSPQMKSDLMHKLPVDFPWTGGQEAEFDAGYSHRRSKGFMALGGAVLFPGLGHLIAGRTQRAAIWFVLEVGGDAALLAVLLTPRWLNALIVLVPLLLVMRIVYWADAAACGRSSSRPMLGDPALRYVAGSALLLCGLVFNHRVGALVAKNYASLAYSPTDSMAPTIVPGDFFLVLRNDDKIARWDIVGLIAPDASGRTFCKRVIGLPGETVEITPRGLLISGEVVPAPRGVGDYMPCDAAGRILGSPDPMAPPGCWGNPIRLAHDEYYCLGDNSFTHHVSEDTSSTSYDSRFWPSVNGHQPGALPADQIVGRVVAILWPSERWRRFD